MRPKLCTRNKLAEVGEHLAAVAYAERKRVIPLEECGKLVPCPGVEQDGLCPALAGTENVSIGEAAAGSEHLEAGERYPAAEDVAHVDIDCLEACMCEGRGHLVLGVDALLAENGDLRSVAGLNVRSCDIIVHVIGEADAEARITAVRLCVKLALCRSRVVADGLHVIGRLAPYGTEGSPRLREYRLAVPGDYDAVIIGNGSDGYAAVSEAVAGKNVEDSFLVLVADLDYGSELLVEEDREVVYAELINCDIYAAVAGKGHFREGDKESAVRTVVVGDNLAARKQELHRVEEALEAYRVVNVRSDITELLVNLGKAGSAEAALSVAEIDEDEGGVALVSAENRSQGLPDILNSRERADNQGKRSSLGFLLAVLVPGGLHGHRVLSDRNADAESRAELHADSLYGCVQACILTRVACCGHPVCGELNPVKAADVGRSDVGEGLAYCHSGGCCVVEEGKRGSLAHCHCLAVVGVIRGFGYSAV